MGDWGGVGAFWFGWVYVFCVGNVAKCVSTVAKYLEVEREVHWVGTWIVDGRWYLGRY